MHPLSGIPDKNVAPTSTWPLVSRPRLHDARTSGFRPGTDLPPLATAIHRPRIDRDRAGPDLDDRPPLLFSMSPNRATASGKSNFSGLSPVGAPGRVADGHFRRAQPPQFAHGCAPTGELLRGYFLVERNSFRFSRLLADLHHLTTAKIWVAGGGAGGDVPDALASALGLPYPTVSPSHPSTLARHEIRQTSVEFTEDCPFFRQRPKTKLELPTFTLATDRAPESCVVRVVMRSLRF